MTDCSYAGERHPAHVTLDGWDFCREHAELHEIEKVGSTHQERDARHTGPTSQAPCGTAAGYYRHRRAHETVCTPCSRAKNGAERLRRKRAAEQRPPRQLRPCGTRAAYLRHIENDEQPCHACTQANRAADAEHKRRQRARKEAA